MPAWFAAVLSWACLTQAAHAWDEGGRTEQFTETAHPLKANELRAGFTRFDAGLPKNFALGSHTLPWVLLIANAHAKWTFLDRENVRLALRAGAYRFDAELADWLIPVDDTDAVLWGFPVDLLASHPVADNLVLNHSVGFTYLFLTGEYNEDEFEGASAFSSLILRTGFQWHFDARFSLVAEVRYVPLQLASGTGAVTTEIDEVTTATAETSLDVVSPPFNEAIGGKMMFRFFLDPFGFALGANVGALEVRSLGVTVPDLKLVPLIDFFWRL